MPYFCRYMFVHETILRVRYSETDQMGVAYHGNFAVWLDVARTEALRSLGLSYRALEASGIMMPVIDMQIQYKQPARYDDVITIQTRLETLPEIKIPFRFDILREGALLSKASVTLACMDASSRRPVRCPEDFLAALRAFF